MTNTTNLYGHYYSGNATKYEDATTVKEGVFIAASKTNETSVSAVGLLRYILNVVIMDNLAAPFHAATFAQYPSCNALHETPLSPHLTSLACLMLSGEF